MRGRVQPRRAYTSTRSVPSRAGEDAKPKLLTAAVARRCHLRCCRAAQPAAPGRELDLVAAAGDRLADEKLVVSRALRNRRLLRNEDRRKAFVRMSKGDSIARQDATMIKRRRAATDRADTTTGQRWRGTTENTVATLRHRHRSCGRRWMRR